MAHPVAKGLKSVGCQLFPDGRNVTIKKGPSNLIQLIAHTYLTSQGLGGERETEQIEACVKHKANATLVLLSSQYLVILSSVFSPSEAQRESAACGPPAC